MEASDVLVRVRHGRLLPWMTHFQDMLADCRSVLTHCMAMLTYPWLTYYSPLLTQGWALKPPLSCLPRYCRKLLTHHGGVLATHTHMLTHCRALVTHAGSLMSHSGSLVSHRRLTHPDLTQDALNVFQCCWQICAGWDVG